jgi:excinuclease ABC subunit A
VIKTADYLIDLGPGGGEAGGRIVGSGTPEELAQNPYSTTGRFLKPVLAEDSRPLPIKSNGQINVPIAIVIFLWERHLAAIAIEAGRLSHI